MVYAHKVNRVTLSGTMFNGAEEWSTGFFLGEEGSDADAASDLAATAILNAWRTFFEATGSHISTGYLTTQCKIALINDTGHTDQSNVYYAYPATELNGAVATPTLPPQCSLVATLLSDRPRGKASKGRMYLPGTTCMPAVTTGKVVSTQIGTIADNLKTFFDALDASFDVPNQLILAAKGTGPVPALTAQNDTVQTIRVGDVIDTQRRRRNGLAETYTSRTLV